MKREKVAVPNDEDGPAKQVVAQQDDKRCQKPAERPESR